MAQKTTSLKITLSEPIHHSSYRVLYGDTDAGGVVYNANYLRYFELGRSDFMRQYITSYKILEDLGIILPVVESYMRHKAPAKYDDLVTIKTSMQQASAISWRFNHHVLRQEDNRLLVKGFTVHAAVNRQGKLTKLPSDILNKMKKIL
ncbi:MAG: acyl-CoA thioesterase [Desulfobulbaceae bacterium]|nr:acyl-CoA thioesterase [Desulfobulbaceae bacterium]